MSLFPSIHAYPRTLPLWRPDGHALRDSDSGIGEEAEFERGERRLRQRYTFAPLVASLKTTLKQAEFDRFVQWYEEDVRAGAERFDLRIAAQGGVGTQWWTGQFIGPYRHECVIAFHNGFGLYRVSCEVLLLDGPHATRTAPGLRGLMVQVAQHPGTLAADVLLRGLMSQSAEHPGRLTLPVLRGLMEQYAEHPGLLAGFDLLRVTDAEDERETDDGELREVDA